MVGAGLAGLATAASLRAAGVSRVAVLERGADVAAFWSGHYDRLQLHSPWHDLPHDGGLRRRWRAFLRRDELVAYLQAYAKHHDLYPLLSVGQAVERVAREGDRWTVETATHRFRAPFVAVATGAQRVPHVPEIPGREVFRGEVVHSRAYRNARPYRGRRVLVVGSGNSAAEIALELAERGAAAVSLWVRAPRHFISLRGFKALAPIARWVGWDFSERMKLRYHAIDRSQPAFRRALERRDRLFRHLSLDLARFGIRKPADGPMVQMYTRGRVPVFDQGTVPLIRAGRIRVVDGNERPLVRFTPGGLQLGDREERFDAVVLATGFRAGLREFLSDAERLLAFDAGLGDHLPRTNLRCRSSVEPGLFFPGFDLTPIGGLSLGLWGWEVGQEIARLLQATRSPGPGLLEASTPRALPTPAAAQSGGMPSRSPCAARYSRTARSVSAS